MKKTLLTATIVLFFATSIFAGNEKTVSVKGQVTDEQGIPIVGAKVAIEGSEASVYTDFDGFFIFSEIPKTSYAVKVSMISFEEQKSTINLQNNSSDKRMSIVLKNKQL